MFFSGRTKNTHLEEMERRMDGQKEEQQVAPKIFQIIKLSLSEMHHHQSKSLSSLFKEHPARNTPEIGSEKRID